MPSRDQEPVSRDRSLEDDLRRIGAWASADEPPTTDALDRRAATGPPPALATSRSPWQRLGLVAAVLALVCGGVLALVARGGGSPARVSPASSDPAPSADSSPPNAGTPVDTSSSSVVGSSVPTTPLGPLSPAVDWRRTAAGPLSARNDAIGVWTGAEVLVFGGTEWPVCPLCDYAEVPPRLLDGAAYDPVSDSWRSIAGLPAEALPTGTALMVGDDMILLTDGPYDTAPGYQLWRYSLAGDSWTALVGPDGAPPAPRIAEFNDQLVLYSGSDEQGTAPDFLLDQATGEWSEVPDDPFDASYDRQMLDVDGNLVLFAKSIARAADSSNPPVVLAAALDPRESTWSMLAESSHLTPPVFASGPLAVAPYRGGADGGETNGWGRTYGYGGIFDLATNTWTDLPGGPTDDGYTGGAVGVSAAFFTGVNGAVLDMVGNEWFDIPPLPNGLSDGYAHTVVAAGPDLFVFGGGGLDGSVHDDAYIWSTGREFVNPAIEDLSSVPTGSVSAVDDFCEKFRSVPTDTSESYVGSQEHLDDVQGLLDASPSELKTDLTAFRDFVASGEIDSVTDPASIQFDNWPVDVRDAVDRIQEFGAATC